MSMVATPLRSLTVRPRIGREWGNGLGSVVLGEPGREAPARGCDPLAELCVERGDLVPELEEAEVEQLLGLADMVGGSCTVDGDSAVGARHVTGLGEAEH